MTRDSIKVDMKKILDTCTGIKVFFIDDDNNELYDSDIESEGLDEFMIGFVNDLKNRFTDNKKLSIPNLSNADDRKNALYYFDFDQRIHEFNYLDKVNDMQANKIIGKYQVKSKGLSSIKAVVIRLKGNDGDVISFYQYIHRTALWTSGKGVFFTTHKTRVVKMTDDVLRLNNNFIFAKIGQSYLINNINAFEKELGFDKIIHAKAEQYCSSIESRGLVNNLEKFNKRLSNETHFARKFVKVFKNSAVIEQELSNEEIISFAMSKPFYENKLKLTEDGYQFDLNSIQRCSYFLQLLDDEFLKSELTGMNYIARAKDRAGS
ncbi:anti-phage protein KwaB [Aeromonas dhakensis]|uniref:anti-phage protein KwaB n=1 Tax=Aeromonas dhakensis TaxID=196024 RepID=UPI003570B72F